jgi:hypothetical protein
MDTFSPTGVREIETDYLRGLKERRSEHFLLGGHLRIADIQQAAKLGSSCLALLIAIHFRRDVTKQDAVTLSSGFLAEFGIDRNAKGRALRSLEAAKLVRVKRIPGKSALVQLTARKRTRK